MFQSDKNNNMSSILGPEIEVNGDLKIKGDILIYGTVLGNVECQGKVHTSKGSIINGNVQSNSAYINGKVEGDLVVREKVVLAKFSQLKGNLVSSTLTIEEGAKFDGLCNMQDKSSSVNKQKLNA
ncbi:MAG: hypothetical protein CMG24_02975 [Candidatus Marinimicrobia bacterium]|nr:hypothetical protein [Candidatus Neomarinimicrobiota bacterium]|tara:strand:+ start:1877 stop:2251 length:375 start_codon:yes stop_codon:yes gene_type:complete